ncbi:MAG: translation elongation factor Ts [Candidatus Marinimicrobia bacterium]|nr:translation elongation factor Ts [Candidatus Neomarinimicrobiota bacterium]
MEITATQVKELRDRTGIGMMDCKGALVEAGGDIDKAIDILRKKGKAKAEKKADRDVKDGLIWSYIHPGNKIGVMVEVNCETDFVAKNEAFQEFVKDIAMHIAATNPAAIRREEIDANLIAKEREIYLEQVRSQNKPANIMERIVDGKLDKYFQENCLMEQAFVKDPQRTIKDYLTETIARIGENINISRFVRYQLGENN